jgi:hypothetical protein
MEMYRLPCIGAVYNIAIRFSPSPRSTGFHSVMADPRNETESIRFHQLPGAWKHPEERYPYERRKAISAPRERCRVVSCRAPSKPVNHR